MWAEFILILYCILVALCSAFGGWLPSVVRLTHRRMQMLVSLVGGLMLGVGLFHLLPHAFAELNSIDLVVRWTMGGLLTTFFLIRAFHSHSHGHGEEECHSGGHSHDHDHDHGRPCGHDHDHDSSSAAARAGLAPAVGSLPIVELTGQPSAPLPLEPAVEAVTGQHVWSWIGLALGLTVHTLIDGLALGASVMADARHGHHGVALLGVGTFLAVALHKPLDALSITGLMLAGNWSPGWRTVINWSYALVCPIGAALFYFGVQQFTDMQAYLVGISVAFAAGVFLCLSLADLLPEVQFHTHDRWALSAFLLAGVALAFAIGFLEPEHLHQHGAAPKAIQHAH